MRISRIPIRIVFIFIGVLSILLIYFALANTDLVKANAYSIVAASMAVITALFSSYSSIKLIENEEDKNKPNISISIDCFSRYGLVQYKICNNGASAAKDIKIVFSKDIYEENADNTILSKIDGKIINYLAPFEELYIPIGVHVKVFDTMKKQVYSGKLLYSDSVNKKYQDMFIVDFDKYKDNITHSDEIGKMAYELQNLPEIVRKLENRFDNYARINEDFIEAKAEYKRYVRKKYQ